MNELNTLRNDKLVREKDLGNGISSFNFSSKAFFNKLWNDETIRARGLFIKQDTGEVAARAYNKFFNIGERPETEMSALKKNLKFPVNVYEKENGFLLIVSSQDGDNLMVCSKSTNQGDFAGYGRAILDKCGDVWKKHFANYLHENNVSAVFECIDPINDPHIVKYSNAHLVLLDIVDNDYEFSHLLYGSLCNIAAYFNLQVKKHVAVLYNYKEFKKFLESVENNKDMEGYVFEDATRFMVKYKVQWYRKWKVLRGVIQGIYSGKHPEDIKNYKDKVNLVDGFDTYINEMFIPQIQTDYYGGCPSIITVRDEFNKYYGD